MKKNYFTGLWIFLFFFSASPICSANENCRIPAVADQFYPRNPKILKQWLDDFFNKAQSHEVQGKILGLLVPHAGYVYSGQVAAEGFKSLQGDWHTIVLIGSSHHVNLKTAGLYSKGAFETPLGKVFIDESVTKELLKKSALFEESKEAHDPEHSLEVEIPFLQKKFQNFKIVPILVNSDDLFFLNQIGEEIACAIKGKNVLIIISSDLSHYPSKKVARFTDLTFLRSLKRMNPEYIRLTSQILLSRGEKNLGTVCCGQSALVAGLYAIKSLGGDKASIIKYVNSGEIERIGDPNRVVGYGTVIFSQSGTMPPTQFSIDEDSKKKLLDAARNSISESFKEKNFSFKEFSENPDFNLPAAVFVTLTKDQQLRGCIGTTTPRTSLIEGIRYFARAAAFEDPRFPPLDKNELAKIRIEISILSSPVPVKNADAVIPKKHGVIAQKGSHSGLFLPTVWEQISDKESFLSELCMQKAGLPSDCWKDSSVHLSVFTTQVFEEK